MRAAEVLRGDVAIGLAGGGTCDHEGEDVRVRAVFKPRRPVQQRHALARRTPAPPAPASAY